MARERFGIVTVLAVFIGACAPPQPQQQPTVQTAGSASSDRYAAIASLPFEGGYPTADTSRTLDEELYFQRAVQTYLWALPAVNTYAMKVGLGKAFGEGYNVVSVFEKRLKPNTVSRRRTPTSSTPWASRT